jgi:hypothetical protein
MEMRKRQKLQVKIEDGKLLIALPQIDPPNLSRSGKSYLVATTGGVRRTRLLVEGLPVHVVATAFVYLDPYEPPAQFVPLIDRPKTDEEIEDEELENEWKTVPLLE